MADRHADEPDYSQTSVGLTDLDVRNTMLASIRLLAVFSLVAAALFWWKSGWQSALLLAVGALISSTSLWEWLRLMTAINQRMDAGLRPGANVAPMGMILFGFFTRLGLTVVVLYASLKYLHGTVFALAAGLGLGLLSLTPRGSPAVETRYRLAALQMGFPNKLCRHSSSSPAF